MCKTSSEKHAQIKTHRNDENNENDHNYEILSPYYLTGTCGFNAIAQKMLVQT